MKRAYHFVNESVEIEIPDSWEQVLQELDRLEYNNNHKETRRNCSFNALDQDGNRLPSDTNLEEWVEQQEEIERLKSAIAALGQNQKKLLWRVYWLEERQAKLAREEGVQRAAVSKRLARIHREIRKLLRKF